MGSVLNTLTNFDRSARSAPEADLLRQLQIAVDAQRAVRPDAVAADIRADLDQFIGQLQAQSYDTGGLERIKRLLLAELSGSRPDASNIDLSLSRLSAALMSVPPETYAAATTALTSGALTLSPPPEAPAFISNRIQWKPETLGTNYYLHPDLGLVKVVGRDGNDVNVMSSDGRTTKVPFARLTSVGSSKFDEVMKERVTKFADLAVVLAPLVICHFLPEGVASYGLDIVSQSIHGVFKAGGSGAGTATSFRSLKNPDIQAKVQAFAVGLMQLATTLGIDPISFILHLADGEGIQSLVNGPGVSARLQRSYDDYFTPDLIWGMLQERPWESRWQIPAQTAYPAVMVAGNLYTPAYQGSERLDDIGDLYEAYSRGDLAAIEQVHELVSPTIHDWMGRLGKGGIHNTVLVPMPGDPNKELVGRLGVRNTVSPWQLLSPNYDRDRAASQTAMGRFRVDREAIQIPSSQASSIAGRHVLLVDAKTGVGTRYMAARETLMARGAASVQMFAAAREVHTPNQLTMKFGPKVMPKRG